MHVKFSGSFPDYTIFICKFKIDECLLLETFKNCKEVKHIMIMIIVIMLFILCDIWSTVQNYFQ